MTALIPIALAVFFVAILALDAIDAYAYRRAMKEFDDGR